MGQGFAPGKQKHRNTETGKIIDHGNALFVGEFIIIGQVFRSGITVNTFEVAALGHIPDHNRFFVL
jgi:hypothetical protein